ncbi:MAG: tRNA (adenosine(37)-N6)-threonylcarbamoyltransferase complex ATPase subunit type 1 TsaE [Saprospiraceae bacterium]|nr:tRNA (adenosine(37)-N6)-threonylcarbamoyltransferase complex ATPase subunit type 1 TsaE [Saprospiraceae bacterium]
MQERLESEGIKVEDDKVVDFKKVFWHPKEQYEVTPIEETDTTTYFSHSVLDLNVIAEKILEEAKNRNISVLTFYGDLGAGKTTLIKAMTKTLGIDEANSPTFSLINEYLDKNGAKVYHMDLYRLESKEEAMDIGIEDYLFSGNLVMIEWPQVIEPLLEEHLKISISRRGDGSRMVSLSV